MKIQNKETQNKLKIVNILTLIVCVSSIIFIYLDIRSLQYRDDLVFILSLLILLYLTYLGCPFFKYDGEGETLIFQNKRSLASSVFVKELQSDFPKRKLKKFNIKKSYFFKKTLEIYISSNRVSGGLSKLRFDISYLSSKQIRNLKISLDKVVKENKLSDTQINKS
ncbi:hypothetical protein ETU08_09535 [Apibacter muscae]|uniref:hypothetical protein n=1 Tax=Apibacter muscae TaxID=2509004 RepID=UPI0011AC9237|nr:hypothetical protein [Apibacter muscae]TWP23005.1 hypothetical protein ETU10_10475 [Apibacter muscae]TWP27952.1 hypothetical protein ETU08_09535 [Apibacter muscae]